MLTQLGCLQTFCKAENLSLIETSALEATNVEKAFNLILTDIYKIVSKKMHQDDGPGKGVGATKPVNMNATPEPAKKSSCCSSS